MKMKMRLATTTFVIVTSFSSAPSAFDECCFATWRRLLAVCLPSEGRDAQKQVNIKQKQMSTMELNYISGNNKLCFLFNFSSFASR